MRTGVRMFVCMYARLWTYTCMHTYIDICTNMRVCICVYIYICIHVCLQMKVPCKNLFMLHSKFHTTQTISWIMHLRVQHCSEPSTLSLSLSLSLSFALSLSLALILSCSVFAQASTPKSSVHRRLSPLFLGPVACFLFEGSALEAVRTGPMKPPIKLLAWRFSPRGKDPHKHNICDLHRSNNAVRSHHWLHMMKQ